MTLTFSLTNYLLGAHPQAYAAATQHSFLLAAARGRLPRPVLGKWLANDHIYIHAYLRAAATLLASLDLPGAIFNGSSPGDESHEHRLADWLIEALVAVRREERMFVDVARRYCLGLEIPGSGEADLLERLPGQGVVSETVVGDGNKPPGLVMMERLFGEVRAPPSWRDVAAATIKKPGELPWLEGAVLFWGTERCYLDAWSWARAQQQRMSVGSGGESGKQEDLDGGALRNEFIPNWSSVEFAQSVARLGGIIDRAVSEVVDRRGDEAKKYMLTRVEIGWENLLAAEAAFWPDVDRAE